MILSDIISEIESFAPLSLQENYDNAGLLTGNHSMNISGALICLDSTEAVIDEAIKKKCNLVIAHHPIIFSGLKKINGYNYVERTIIKAIKNDIAIYACHTNLDNIKAGVNSKIAEKLGLKNAQILSHKKDTLKKIVTFCPVDSAEKIRIALCLAGAGSIGNYDSCSFSLQGEGTFRGNEHSTPYVGKKEELHIEKETRIELVFESCNEKKILNALLKHHPYEQVAYDIFTITNLNQNIGSGMIGEFESEMDAEYFLKKLKEVFKSNLIRHTKIFNKKIKKVGVCGGSGSFLLNQAISAHADAFVSSDFKYHEFFDADEKILVADIGHAESEQFTGEIFYELIQKKFPTFAIQFSEIDTNPINYF